MVKEPKDFHAEDIKLLFPFLLERKYHLLAMDASWNEFFEQIKGKDYAKSLHAFLEEEYEKHTCYPPREMMFRAFELTPASRVKAVIVGQDPYSNPHQAMGLCFSVPKGVEIPPSLVNVYTDLQDELGIKMDFNSGDLTHWAEQGVLLLNVYLSVIAHTPLSHKRKEYDAFAQDVFAFLDKLPQPIVFFLWGSFAGRFAKLVTNHNHLVLRTGHPSPLSANRGLYFGSNQFNKAEAFWRERGVEPVQWSNVH